MSRGGVDHLVRGYKVTVTVLSVLIYTSLAPSGYALFALASLLVGRRRSGMLALQWAVRGGLRAMHWWLRAVGLLNFAPRQLRRDVEAHCTELKGQSFIVVANHPTLTDAAALLSSIPHLCAAVRSDLYNTLWLKPLLAGCGHFDAGPPNPLGATRFLERAAERLRQGFRVLVFPEGSRSPAGRLSRLGRSAFELACRAEVPILALLIIENPTFLAKGDGLLTHPVPVAVKRVQILGILRPADFSRDSRRMRDYLEARYRESLGERAKEGPGPLPDAPCAKSETDPPK